MKNDIKDLKIPVKGMSLEDMESRIQSLMNEVKDLKDAVKELNENVILLDQMRVQHNIHQHSNKEGIN